MQYAGAAAVLGIAVAIAVTLTVAPLASIGFLLANPLLLSAITAVCLTFSVLTLSCRAIRMRRR